MLITLLLTIATLDTAQPQAVSLLGVINAKRRIEDVQELKMDKGLNRLAYLHCMDLEKYNDTSCSLISWSKNSGYSYGCVNKDNPGLEVMLNKPKEVLGYDGVGHELVILTDIQLDYEKAYTLLRRSLFYSKLLVGQDYTKVGLYMHKNILSVWLMK